MPKEIRILVCTEGKKCSKRGSKKVLRAIETAIARLGRQDVSCRGCKCLSLCKTGPSVVVMPDRASYGGVSPRDADALVEAHASGSEPVERLVVQRKRKK